MIKRLIRKFIRKELYAIIREDAERRAEYLAEVDRFVDAICPPREGSSLSEINRRYSDRRKDA